MKTVEVVVTNTVSGVAPVVPYSHERGLEFYVTSTGIECVEILDGRWNGFLDEIERLAGAASAQIGAASKLKVTLVSASYPTAKRRL